MRNIVCAACLLLSGFSALYAQSDVVNDYSVVWDTPSGDASGAMPIGNGEVGANVWMEGNGNMVFYLSRTDAWAENAALYKLGKLRVSLYPCLNGDDVSFKQFLNLAEGKIEVTIKDKKDEVKMDFLVDSESPVVYLKGQSTYPVQVTVSSEIWRTQIRQIPAKELFSALQDCPQDSLKLEYPDVVSDANDNLVVYHRNEHSIYPYTLKLQELENEENRSRDPFLSRTMGYNVSGEGFVKYAPTIIASKTAARDFCIKIAAYTEQTRTAKEWIDRTTEILRHAPTFEDAALRTADYWKKYWDKSYIRIATPDGVTGNRITQAYVLQNWVSACGGRGNYPIKFNGSIFTVDPVYTDSTRMYNPDFRLWGPDYWWQNTRLVYHPMLKSGDYDMMRVLFRHYFSNLPMLKRNAEVFFGAEGAVTPETSTIFGTFINYDYGWDRNKLKIGEVRSPYVRHYWSPGLEIVALMYDCYQYSDDEAFASDTLVPMSREVLKFYTSFFPRDEKGKLRITPTHALETYWTDVVNDMPNVAGLHYVVNSLLTLPDGCATKEDRRMWKEIQQSLPDVPTERKEGTLVFSAAEQYADQRSNSENPDLYAIFPFPLCNISTANHQLGVDSYNNRLVRGETGWRQDGQQAARLGLTEEVRSNLLVKIQNKHPRHRFPAYWGPNFDWTPDQDNGGNLLMTVQDMVVQSYGNTVYVLPAFPKDWDVSFRLCTFGKNTVSGEYRQGKWIHKPSLEKKSKQKIRIVTK